MKYERFRDSILRELKNNPKGLTWLELKKKSNLPYKQPCQTWVGQLEHDIGLKREKGESRALIWKVDPNGK